jgi:hypothetical protein
MIKKLRNEPYAPKWEQEEEKTLLSAYLAIISAHSEFVVVAY